MSGACIYDPYSPCEECGRCKSKREILEEATERGEIDEDHDAWRDEDDDNYYCWEGYR